MIMLFPMAIIMIVAYVVYDKKSRQNKAKNALAEAINKEKIEKRVNYFITETRKIKNNPNKSSMGTYLQWFVREALPEKTITLYEAFQLMEISDRMSRDKFWVDSSDVVQSMNLALLAKLFNEIEMYETFCRDAREKLALWNKILKKSNGGLLPDGYHYILSDLDGYLSGDTEHMKRLSEIRKSAPRDNPGEELYHFEYFPFDEFVFEDIYISLANGELDRFDIDKTISCDVCFMMSEIEVRAVWLE